MLSLYARVLQFFSPLARCSASHHHSSTTMQHSALFLAVVVLALSRLATAAAVLRRSGVLTFSLGNNVECFGGVYAANGTYEANLRRLAKILPAETASSQSLQALRGLGYWPNRVRAFSHCYYRDSACAACVADAFRQAERACPYGKKVFVLGDNCSLSLADFPRSIAFGSSSLLELLGAGLVFQAIGFAWLLFLLLQEWRDKRRRSMTRSSSIPSGDQ